MFDADHLDGLCCVVVILNSWFLDKMSRARSGWAGRVRWAMVLFFRVADKSSDRAPSRRRRPSFSEFWSLCVYHLTIMLIKEVQYSRTVKFRLG